MAAYDDLKPQYRLFVDAYVGECRFRQQDAAVKAGYAPKAARLQAYRLMRRKDVREAIDTLLKEHAMSAGEVLAQLTDIARGNIGDVVRFEEGSFRLDLKRAKAEGNLGLISELSESEHGPKVKLYSRADALRDLGKFHKLFVDKVELDVTDLDPLPKVGNEELLAEMAVRFGSKAEK